ncbi:hypothetical protein ABZ318_31030 [Streptomyces sp. NPDC006197]|uniref:hypothetical protein n=1 Tax=Streptomyces sp. NPDC006197 TaxID=3156685 RepID=UPI0033A52DC2
MTGVIPLPPHRTKGLGVLGAMPGQPEGSFGRWPKEYEDDSTAVPPGSPSVAHPKASSPPPTTS